jgi:hypothetical protein
VQQPRHASHAYEHMDGTYAHGTRPVLYGFKTSTEIKKTGLPAGSSVHHGTIKVRVKGLYARAMVASGPMLPRASALRKRRAVKF